MRAVTASSKPAAASWLPFTCGHGPSWFHSRNCYRSARATIGTARPTAACSITTSRGECLISWRSNTSFQPPGTSYRTFRASLKVLDAIAALKQIDAIVCDAANARLSDRFMARQGWEPHKPQRWHRNYIRRFYGEYPVGRVLAPAD